MKTVVAQTTTLDQMLLDFEAGPGDSRWCQALQYLLADSAPQAVRNIIQQAMQNAIAEAIPKLTQAVYGAKFQPTAYNDDDAPMMSLSAAAESLGLSETELLALMQAAGAEDGDDGYLLSSHGAHSTN